MTWTERNKAIKAHLARIYGPGNVRVRSGRGTAAGWVEVDIYIDPVHGGKAPTEVSREAQAEIIRGFGPELCSYYDDGMMGERYSLIAQAHIRGREVYIADAAKVFKPGDKAYTIRPGYVNGQKVLAKVEAIEEKPEGYYIASRREDGELIWWPADRWQRVWFKG